MIRNTKRAFGAVAGLGAVAAAAIFVSHAGAQTSAGPFTEAQATAGRDLYVSTCSACHDGGGETIRLIGPAFTGLPANARGPPPLLAAQALRDHELFPEAALVAARGTLELLVAEFRVRELLGEFRVQLRQARDLLARGHQLQFQFDDSVFGHVMKRFDDGRRCTIARHGG